MKDGVLNITSPKSGPETILAQRIRSRDVRDVMPVRHGRLKSISSVTVVLGLLRSSAKGRKRHDYQGPANLRSRHYTVTVPASRVIGPDEGLNGRSFSYPFFCCCTHPANHLATLLLPAPACCKRSNSRKKVSIHTRSIARRCATRQRHIHKKRRWISIANLKLSSQFSGPLPPSETDAQKITSRSQTQIPLHAYNLTLP
jgi:hypothetical protein